MCLYAVKVGQFCSCNASFCHLLPSSHMKSKLHVLVHYLVCWHDGKKRAALVLVTRMVASFGHTRSQQKGTTLAQNFACACKKHRCPGRNDLVTEFSCWCFLNTKIQQSELSSNRREPRQQQSSMCLYDVKNGHLCSCNAYCCCCRSF